MRVGPPVAAALAAALALPLAAQTDVIITIPQDPEIHVLGTSIARLEARIDSLIAALAEAAPAPGGDALMVATGGLRPDSVDLLFHFEEGTWDGFIGFRDAPDGRPVCPPARPPVTSPARTTCVRGSEPYDVWATDPFPRAVGPVRIPALEPGVVWESFEMFPAAARLDSGAVLQVYAAGWLEGVPYACAPEGELVEVALLSSSRPDSVTTKPDSVAVAGDGAPLGVPCDPLRWPPISR